jgi:hypothetical protein
MPNPAMMNEQSPKILHFLGLVDIYLSLGKPAIYTVEPDIDENYRPDAYCRLGDFGPTLIELQRSTISKRKMQEKVNGFVLTYQKKKHDAKTLLIYTDKPYSLDVPYGFQIVQRKLEA